MTLGLYEAEEALWTTLGRDVGYVGLGLREFRAHRGEPIPYDPLQKTFPSSALPAIYSEHPSISNESPTENAVQLQSTVPMGLIYPANSDRTRQTIEAAGAIVSKILAGRDAGVGHLGDGATVSMYRWAFRDVLGLSPGSDGRPQFWLLRFRVVLTLPTVYPL